MQNLRYGAVAVMDPLLAARQASNAAASSSQSIPQYLDFNSSLPVFSAINAGYTQASHMPADFEHALNRAHEHYRAGDYHKALQLCHSVRASLSFAIEASHVKQPLNPGIWNNCMVKQSFSITRP